MTPSIYIYDFLNRIYHVKSFCKKNKEFLEFWTSTSNLVMKYENLWENAEIHRTNLWNPIFNLG